MITTEDHPPIFVPLIHWFKKVFFAQAYQNIVVVHPYFGCFIANVSKQRIQIRDNIVPFSLFELSGKIFIPEVPAQVKVQFIRKEEVQTFAPFTWKGLFEFPEKMADIRFPACRIHRIK